MVLLLLGFPKGCDGINGAAFAWKPEVLSVAVVVVVAAAAPVGTNGVNSVNFNA